MLLFLLSMNFPNAKSLYLHFNPTFQGSYLVRFRTRKKRLQLSDSKAAQFAIVLQDQRDYNSHRETC